LSFMAKREPDGGAGVGKKRYRHQFRGAANSQCSLDDYVWIGSGRTSTDTEGGVPALVLTDENWKNPIERSRLPSAGLPSGRDGGLNLAGVRPVPIPAWLVPPKPLRRRGRHAPTGRRRTPTVELSLRRLRRSPEGFSISPARAAPRYAAGYRARSPGWAMVRRWGYPRPLSHCSQSPPNLSPVGGFMIHARRQNDSSRHWMATGR